MKATGKPVIVPAASGHWFLGKQTPHGVQLDIENFTSLHEARRWCSLRGMKPLVFLDGHTMQAVEVEQLEALFRDLPLSHRRGLAALIKAGLVVKAGRGKAAVHHLTLAGRTLMQGTH